MPKGKKTCKSCGKEVALRTSKCDCGFEFTIKKKEENQEPEVVVNRGELRRVTTPGTGAGGKDLWPIVPVKPEGLDDISNWIENCQIWGEKHSVTYAKSAIEYMARQIWRDDELNKALLLIAEDFKRRRQENLDEIL